MQAEGDRATNLSGITWRLGDWVVNATANEVRRGDTVVRLEPKSMEVLLVLAERAGQAVTRETLLSRIWPDVVVGDATLTQAVIKLRKALGDDARSPAYIETISKRGYRLLAAPQPLGSGTPDPLNGPASAGYRLAAGRKAARIGLLVSVLAVVGLATYLMSRPTDLTTDVAEWPAEFAADTSASIATISVIPFDSIGDDQDQLHLARGIAADLATDLGRLAGLRVIAAPQSLQDANKASLARYSVFGSLQRGAGYFRINVRLMDGASGRQLWSERYERPARDLFALQEEITRKLVDSLAVEISHAERALLAHRHTRNLEAYDFFLRGQTALAVRQLDENEKAREWYRSALALDPTFARPYVGIALTYAEDYRLRWADDRAAALTKARQYAETAGQIDPNLREVQWVFAYISVQERKFDRAVSHLKRAIALDPSYADAYALLGLIHTYTGEAAEAVRILRIAMRLNPNAGYLYFQHLGRAYYFLGDTELAVLNLREALMRNPLDLDGHMFLVATLAASGDSATAKWEADEILNARPDITARQWTEMIPMQDIAPKRRLNDLLVSAGL